MIGDARPARVLVVNGTMGAGKSTVASAVADLLHERRVPAGLLDADALCQAEPAPAGDRFNESLLFDNLAAIAPNYLSRGFTTLVIARVIEDAGDRGRYAHAFALDGLAAEVVVVRVTAPEPERVARLAAREPEGKWRDFALARTVELEASLDALGLDDHTVVNSGRAAAQTAEEVLRLIGW
jgi:predicted kinase